MIIERCMEFRRSNWDGESGQCDYGKAVRKTRVTNENHQKEIDIPLEEDDGYENSEQKAREKRESERKAR